MKAKKEDFFSRLFSNTFSRAPKILDTTPSLKNIAAFKEFLDAYQLSTYADSLLDETPLVLMTSVSSAGRNTVINELVKTGRYFYVVSDTTRPPRMNNGVWEQDGVEYFFRSEDEVLVDLQKGRYIAPAIIHNQQVSGINIGELEKAKAAGKTPITEVDIVGAIEVLAQKPSTTTIFIIPPSFEEWFGRMRRRGNFSRTELHRRLKSALNEYKTALGRRDIAFIINDRLYDTVAAVDGIVKGAHNQNAEKKARAVARELYAGTQEYLDDNPEP